MISRCVSVLKDIALQVETHRLEVLVVDSQSTDETVRVVEAILPTWSGLHLLIEPQRSGLGGAYLLGMRHAIDRLHADVVTSFDADLSHDATKIPTMLERILDGDDVVVGTRYVREAKRSSEWIWYRHQFSRVSNRIFSAAFGFLSVSDWTGGFRSYKKTVFEQVEPTLKSYTGYVFQTAFLHRALLNGARVSEIPYVFVNRLEGRSKLRFRDTIGFILYLLHNLRLQKPNARRV